MAVSLPYVPLALVGKAGQNYYQQGVALPLPGALFRRGDVLVEQTVGSLVNPNPNGSIGTFQPTVAPTIGSTSSAGAPSQYLYAFYTYIGAAAIESLPSQEFVINVAAGTEATVTVPSAGAPAGATDFALYVGTVQGNEVQQVASTALGSAATIVWPLTNRFGVNRAATNVASGVVGMALDDYDVLYVPQPGNAAQTGSRSLFGVDQTGPLQVLEPYSTFYVKPADQVFEISLVQPYYTNLLQQTAGLVYSTQYNCFAADTSQSNKILTIVGKAVGSQNPNYGEATGAIGDSGARIFVRFNSGYLA